MLVFDLVVAAVVVMVWWACLATLSPAGVNLVWHRCLVLCVALPVAVVGSFAMIVLPFAAFILLKEAHSPVGYWLLLAEPVVGGGHLRSGPVHADDCGVGRGPAKRTAARAGVVLSGATVVLSPQGWQYNCHPNYAEVTAGWSGAPVAFGMRLL